MKINGAQILKSYDGSDLKDPEGKPVQLRTIIANALNSTEKDEKQTGEMKIKLYQISLKFYESDELDLTNEQLVLIEQRVAKFYNALIVGRVAELLNKP